MLYHYRNGTDTSDLKPTQENIERKISILTNYQKAQEEEARFQQNRSSFDTFKSGRVKGGIFASSRRGSLGKESAYQIPLFSGVNDLAVPGGSHGRRAAVVHKPIPLKRYDSNQSLRKDSLLKNQGAYSRNNSIVRKESVSSKNRSSIVIPKIPNIVDQELENLKRKPRSRADTGRSIGSLDVIQEERSPKIKKTSIPKKASIVIPVLNIIPDDQLQ